MGSLLLKNGWVVDPVNRRGGEADIFCRDGCIEEIGKGLNESVAEEIIDIRGRTAIPGIIDTHVHLRGHLDAGYKMLAKAGVTTAVDFAGPIEEIIRGIREKGKGLSIAVLNGIIPGESIPSGEGPFSGAADFIDKSLEEGSYGIKILGGHYPLSAEISGRIIEYCNKIQTYIAFHAGTLEVPDPFPSFLQAVDLAGKNSLHLAHVNSYCRGREKDYLDEMSEALRLLEEHENIFSDSYLSDINGTSGKTRNGEFLSNVTKRELAKGGYPLTEEGIKKAFTDEYALAGKELAGENILVSGKEAADYWEEMKTDIMISFSVNPSINAVAFALRRDKKGAFTVDTISTDGGGIPRNSIVRLGLPLTRYRDFTIEDFVRKTSVNPARLFGLTGKGRLSPGADADITVLDTREFKPVMSVAGGKIIMKDGYVTGRGGTLITTERGEAAVKGKGIPYTLADVRRGIFFQPPIQTQSRTEE